MAGLVHCAEGHELQAVVDPRAREIAAGEMDQVEGPLVAEAPDRVQGRGLDRTRRQKQPHVEGRAIDGDVARRLGDAGPAERRRGRDHGLHGVDRELADRHRQREQPVRRQQAEQRAERLDRQHGAVGLRLREEFARHVDDVEGGVARERGQRQRARVEHTPAARHFQRPDRPQAGDQRATQHRVRLDHLDGRGAGAQRLVDPEAAGGAEQQGACAGPQPVGQRIERGAEVGGVGLALARQGGDAVAVEIETEGTRQSLHAQPAGIVGEVAVEALDEAVDQEIVALRRADLGQHLAAARVERREDVLELVHPGLVQQHEARLARQEDGEGEEAEPAARCMGPSLEPGRERQRRQEAGDEVERRHHEHQRQHPHGAEPGAGQIGGIDAADLRGVEDEDERDVEADQEEEGEQRRVALRRC